MKTLLEQVINELKLSKVSTGDKLNQNVKPFKELEVGDMLYYAYVGSKTSFIQTGKIYRKRDFPDGSFDVFWEYERNNKDFRRFNIDKSAYEMVDGNLSDASGVILKGNGLYWIYSTYEQYVISNFKKLSNKN